MMRFPLKLSLFSRQCFGLNVGLSKMKRLNLGWCGRLDDAELAHVARLSALTSLELARTKVCCMPSGLH